MNIVVANKIKTLRKDKKMSQEEMADYLNMSQSAYARMENGESHTWAIHILKICKIFGIAPEELLKVESSHKTGPSDNAIPELSHTVIEHYEERIKELKKVIKDLKNNKKLLNS
ncbi:helix-turn-helix domain-containing protein [Flavobacterium sp. AC]|uniref:Helix-turn-helix domain-containing protein n=1 Tax=Flavobacterium azizsancarii TaxID=2961580 RepID=A0ABT4WFW6_9FLAO|nr:helix-turn-helix transcriptional regulator [Flavobacterium azizsancarii]MDA6071463.1 helix-turn-helix domain-containing protein [Flavobacterium azizsancarii]